MNITPDIEKQITEAYNTLIDRGLAHPDWTPAERAAWFWQMEDNDEWSIGYIDYPDRKALVYLIEGLRYLACGTEGHDNALACIRLAVADIKARR